MDNNVVDKKEEYIKSLERNVKILEKRLHDSKQKNREEKLKLKYDLKKAQEYGEQQRQKFIEATNYQYDSTSFDGLIHFAHNIRQYLLAGLKHMKSCSKCLEHTCPDDIKREKDKNGEYILKFNEYGFDGCKERPEVDYRRDWGSILSKMIRALELKEKYFNEEYNMTSADKKIMDEGMELLIKYHDCFYY